MKVFNDNHLKYFLFILSCHKTKGQERKNARPPLPILCEKLQLIIIVANKVIAHYY